MFSSDRKETNPETPRSNLKQNLNQEPRGIRQERFNQSYFDKNKK